MSEGNNCFTQAEGSQGKMKYNQQKRPLNAVSVARRLVGQKIYRSIREFTKGRNRLNVTNVTRVLVCNDIWRSIKEHIRGRNLLCATSVAGVFVSNGILLYMKEYILAQDLIPATSAARALFRQGILWDTNYSYRRETFFLQPLWQEFQTVKGSIKVWKNPYRRETVCLQPLWQEFSSTWASQSAQKNTSRRVYNKVLRSRHPAYFFPLIPLSRPSLCLNPDPA